MEVDEQEPTVREINSLVQNMCLGEQSFYSATPRQLTDEERSKLHRQDERGLLPDFQRNKLEKQAAANWDKFYKRNETRFFKDRHWTTREFQELLSASCPSEEGRKVVLEVGCGVGNFFYPLLSEGLNLRVLACDFSPRAIELVRQHPQYDSSIVTAFVADITQINSLTSNIPSDVPKVDFITSIFVFSALSPDTHVAAAQAIASVCSRGTMLLFRDYAVNDMAMIRFNPGSKISDRFYVRQDGTRAYYFHMEEIIKLFGDVGFICIHGAYVHRKTQNIKEGVDAARLFCQAKFVYERSDSCPMTD